MRVNEILKHTVFEDVNQDIAAINAQIAALMLRKQNATKVLDQQIRILQQQLAVRTKQASIQQPQQNNQQQQSPQNRQPAADSTNIDVNQASPRMG